MEGLPTSISLVGLSFSFNISVWLKSFETVVLAHSVLIPFFENTILSMEVASSVNSISSAVPVLFFATNGQYCYRHYYFSHVSALVDVGKVIKYERAILIVWPGK